MQPRSDDRFILYLAAWLEAMEEDDDHAEAGRDVHMPAGVPASRGPSRPQGAEGLSKNAAQFLSIRCSPRGSSSCIPKLES